MSFSETFLPEFNHEMAATRKILERVPDALFTWKPHAKSMTLGRLASHVAEMPSWAGHAINLEKLVIGPGDKPANAPNNAELLNLFDGFVIQGRHAIAGVTDDQLTHVWQLEYNGRIIISMPRRELLRGIVMNHMIHHRGQLSVYLRLHDIPVPGMYGPSADEQ